MRKPNEECLKYEPQAMYVNHQIRDVGGILHLQYKVDLWYIDIHDVEETYVTHICYLC